MSQKLSGICIDEVPMQLKILSGKIHKLKKVIYNFVLSHSLDSTQSHTTLLVWFQGYLVAY